ncbi:Uncharacterised protein [Kingella kingae]|nr:Uncharacterised protein [Kingella kingae]
MKPRIYKIVYREDKSIYIFRTPRTEKEFQTYEEARAAFDKVRKPKEQILQILEPAFTNNYLINFNICEIYPSLTKFSADKFVCSKSFAKRPDQPNHANVRSTIQRLGRIRQEIS